MNSAQTPVAPAFTTRSHTSAGPVTVPVSGCSGALHTMLRCCAGATVLSFDASLRCGLTQKSALEAGFQLMEVGNTLCLPT